jgi:undecaprenyl-diphosphatase
LPTFLAIIILGIVEGITEFLPVSSTGHLLIAEQWLPRQTDLFNLVIQTGAVLAVSPLFRERFHQFLYDWSDPRVRDYFLKIVVAFLITGAGGYMIDKRGFKLPEELTPVAIALLVGGVAFVLVETVLSRRRTAHEPARSELAQVTWMVVIAVGVGQLIAAAFPGLSRSGTTILFSLILGLGRPLATEFSFLVSIPTMLAAGALKIFQAFHEHAGAAVHENWSMVILGTVISAAVSFVAVKWLLRYVQTHTFVLFGAYRVVIGGALIVSLDTHFICSTPQ